MDDAMLTEIVLSVNQARRETQKAGEALERLFALAQEEEDGRDQTKN